jgi:vacuolar-type H+-ATPase subunit I/STV1
MSDMRFIIIGIVLTFFGFLVLGVFGHDFKTAHIETSQFGDCYQYFDNKEPVAVNCSSRIFDQSLFFGIVLALIISGIVSLVKGIRGDWDSKVNPEDMVGPDNNKNSDKD